MLSEKMEKALNAQINAEFWSAYLYLSMSVHFSAKGMKGVANWFAVQFKEEQDHAQIFVDYVLARGGRVTLAPIAEVPCEWESPLAAFEATLVHEKKVTTRCAVRPRPTRISLRPTSWSGSSTSRSRRNRTLRISSTR